MDTGEAHSLLPAAPSFPLVLLRVAQYRTELPSTHWVTAPHLRPNYIWEIELSIREAARINPDSSAFDEMPLAEMQHEATLLIEENGALRSHTAPLVNMFLLVSVCCLVRSAVDTRHNHTLHRWFLRCFLLPTERGSWLVLHVSGQITRLHMHTSWNYMNARGKHGLFDHHTNSPRAYLQHTVCISCLFSFSRWYQAKIHGGVSPV